MGIILTNTICWEKFERAGLGNYKRGALSWMFLQAKLPWDWILAISVMLILTKLGITEGVLVADDTDHKRAKVTRKLFKTHKVYDKKTGGYFNGQTVVLLLLVTPLATIPVGFRFYRPDPVQTAWRKEDKKLTRQGIKKSDRPVPPPYNPDYPTQAMLVIEMIKAFRHYHPHIVVKSILADALYGSRQFMDDASQCYPKMQVISQLRSNQNIRFLKQEMSLDTYFSRYPGTPYTINIRGQKETTIVVGSARLHVVAQNCKRFVIALKYDGETSYRYLVATDMSWRTLDIVQTYTLRWLVEVFFEDWKLHEGWGQLAKQPGEEGSSRSLILSLLCDHALILHPEQIARLENKLPAYTVGSLCERSRSEALLASMRHLLSADNPSDKIAQLANKIKQLFPLSLSGKHMVGRDLGRMESTPSLVYRAIEVSR
jgi:hypothetical protein